MNDADRDQIRECIRRAGGPKPAAIALGVNVTTLARALAGLPVLPMSASYLRLSMPRVLAKLPAAGPIVERAG